THAAPTGYWRDNKNCSHPSAAREANGAVTAGHSDAPANLRSTQSPTAVENKDRPSLLDKWFSGNRDARCAVPASAGMTLSAFSGWRHQEIEPAVFRCTRGPVRNLHRTRRSPALPEASTGDPSHRWTSAAKSAWPPRADVCGARIERHGVGHK